MNRLFRAGGRRGDRGQAGAHARQDARWQAQQLADTMFQQLDANHDGVVTRAEADQARPSSAAAHGDSNGGHGGGRFDADRQVFGTAQSLTLAQFEAAGARPLRR